MTKLRSLYSQLTTTNSQLYFSGVACGEIGSCVLLAVFGHAGFVEVLLHGAAGLDGVAGADGAEDLAVRLGGLLEGPGVADGEAAIVVEVRGDGLHQGAEDGVSGGAGDGAGKADVGE